MIDRKCADISINKTIYFNYIFQKVCDYKCKWVKPTFDEVNMS